MGFTINNLTLFGLVLAIGIVVDDAIVVLENIERWLAKGLNVRDATIKAMDEITGPIIAITLVLSAVFLPSAFLGGISGQFFRQFALTIAASMIISAVNAMTMTPARAAAIFAGRKHGARWPRRWPRSVALVVLRPARRRRGVLRLSGRWSRRSLACRRARKATYGPPGSVKRMVATYALEPGAVPARRSSPAASSAGSSFARSTGCSAGSSAASTLVFDAVTRILWPNGRLVPALERRRAAALWRPARPDLFRLHHRSRRVHSESGQGLPDRQRAAPRLRVAGPHHRSHGPDPEDRRNAIPASRTPWTFRANRSS